ncbi:MAG TPA: imidazole glycerol phosphate synthase subunit HisH [Alphaproteobacteria bacterium]|jgi:glutamine amidotransferase
MSVAIVDYGSGNLRSAAKAFERAGDGRPVAVTNDPAAVARADHIVLPGVGAFGDCAAGLRALPGMVEALNEQVIGRGRPFLGICVGMQLMAERGLEHGVHEGLGWIPGEVVAIAAAGAAGARLKVPHMGWNDLALRMPDHPLLRGIETGEHAYFVHGYRMAPAEAGDVLAEVDHGGPIAAAVGRDNLAGTQFHPEKSQAVGLRLIANFLAWRP